MIVRPHTGGDNVLESAQVLLIAFEQNGIRKEVREKRERALKNSRDLLQQFQQRKVRALINTFNPVEALLKRKGEVLNEDDHTDLMASILDPHGKHQMQTEPVIALLDLVGKKKTQKEGQCEAIRTQLREDPRHVTVYTRRHDSLSAVDIKIEGEEFIIGIENKRSMGGEHETSSGAQTENQWRDLLSYGKNHVLHLYIHPLGVMSECPESVCLDKHDLCSWYEMLAEKSKDKELAAFLRFYARFYFKTI